MIYRKVKLLDLSDAAYIAGLIDGEGTVTLTRRNRYKNRGLVVSISNNEIPILKHVQGKIGAGKEYLRLTRRNGRYTNEQSSERETFVRNFFAIRSSERVMVDDSILQ